MIQGATLSLGGNGSSSVGIGILVVGGIAALWCGVSWAFNVRGITVRRAEEIRQRHAVQLGGVSSGTMWARPWYHRLLGAVLAVAGLVLVIAGYALWHLG
ncbi:hypothetical protein ACFPFX_31475 [Streptomyces mauvecolor]|uniref:Integral membrane protein n=1 Tax=Streptomyces mauvecolor TaxID=58345 RepID=A0ABV9UZL9_9ACTN